MAEGRARSRAGNAAHPKQNAPPRPLAPAPTPAPTPAASWSLRRSPRGTRCARCAWTPPCWGWTPPREWVAPTSAFFFFLLPLPVLLRRLQFAVCAGGAAPSRARCEETGAELHLPPLRGPLPAHAGTPGKHEPSRCRPPPTTAFPLPQGQGAAVHCEHGHLCVQGREAAGGWEPLGGRLPGGGARRAGGAAGSALRVGAAGGPGRSGACAADSGALRPAPLLPRRSC